MVTTKPGVTTTKLNLRLWPSTKATIRVLLDTNESLEVLPDTITADNNNWLSVYVRGMVGWCSAQYVSVAGAPPTPSPTPTPNPNPNPPPTTRILYGFHVLANADTSGLLELARRDKLAAATVVDDVGLVNQLLGAGVPNVVHRHYLPDSINFAQMSGDTSDINRGANWFQQYIQPTLANLDRRALVQGPNEQNAANDGFWYLGFMQAADAAGYKAIIFNDASGTQDLGFDGVRWYSAAWQRRYDSGALKYAKANNHFVGYHGYGGNRNGDPASEIWPDGHRDDDTFNYFAGRIINFYSFLPEDGKPNVLLTEAGRFDGNRAGAPFLINDMITLANRFGPYPWFRGYCYWTLGPWSANPNSQLDSYMPDVIRAIG